MASKPRDLAAHAIFHNDAGPSLFLNQSATSKTNTDKWELPGGTLEPRERFDDAVRREAEEDAGLKIALAGLAGAVESDHPAVKVVCLIIETEIRDGAVRLSREHDAYMWADETAFARFDLGDHF
jgi:8-oxo-dGTP diphosphatase